MATLKRIVSLCVGGLWTLVAGCSCGRGEQDTDGDTVGGNTIGHGTGGVVEGLGDEDWRYTDDCELGGLAWPVGNGTTPCLLRATYGQAEGEKAPLLHLGLDVVESQGAGVYALEAGKIVRVETGLTNFRGVIVASEARCGRAFLYLHVNPLEPQLVAGSEVSAGDFLGTVECVWEPHVHLSRLEGDYVAQGWDKIDELSVRNPLALLKPEYLADATEPTIANATEPLLGSVDGDPQVQEPLGFRSNEIPYSSDLTYYPSSNLPSGALDVLARVHDSDGRSAGPLAPYRLSLSVDGEPKFRLLFDGSLAGVMSRDVYNRDDDHMTTRGTNLETPSVFFFELTNGQGAKPAESGAWAATAGPHTLELCVHDVAGKATKRTMSVTIQP